MTTTTITTNTEAPTLTIKNGELVQNQRFMAFLERQQRLQAAVDTAWEELQTVMEQHNIRSVRGSWGYITLAERETLTATTPLAPRFYKRVVDTTKLRAHETLHGSLPDGVVRRSSTYLSRRFK